jgi:hypothetical protein
VIRSISFPPKFPTKSFWLCLDYAFVYNALGVVGQPYCISLDESREAEGLILLGNEHLSSGMAPTSLSPEQACAVGGISLVNFALDGEGTYHALLTGHQTFATQTPTTVPLGLADATSDADTGVSVWAASAHRLLAFGRPTFLFRRNPRRSQITDIYTYHRASIEQCPEFIGQDDGDRRR